MVITQDRFRGALDQSLDQSPPSLLPLTSLLYLGHTEAGLPTEGHQKAPPVLAGVEVDLPQPPDGGPRSAGLLLGHTGGQTGGRLRLGTDLGLWLDLSLQSQHLGRSRLLGQLLNKICKMNIFTKLREILPYWSPGLQS